MNTILQTLKDCGIAESIKQLRTYTEPLGNWELSNQFEHIQQTYTQMLRFWMEGYEDPDFEKMKENIRQHILGLTHRAERMWRLRNQPNTIYALTLRAVRNDINIDNLSKLLTANDDSSTTQAFNYIWTSGLWHKSDCDVVLGLLNNDAISDNNKAIITAALFMSVLECFDRNKVAMLLDAYLIDNVYVSSRAIVGLTVIAKMRHEVIELYPELVERFKDMCLDDEYVADTFETLMQLQRSCLTENVTEKLTSKVIPALLANKELGRKKMTDMQVNGDDVYAPTFSHMKRNAFFSPTAHWLYLFDKDIMRQQIGKAKLSDTADKLLKVMMKAAPFCDSDKYTFCMMINELGTEMQDKISAELLAQFTSEDIEDLLQNDTIDTPSKRRCIRNFIFDLYRLMTVNTFHTQYTNPFAIKVYDALTQPLFFGAETHRDHILTFCKLYVSKAMYDKALEVYERIGYKLVGEDYEILQNIGFCHEKLGNLPVALNYYTKADSAHPDSTWLLNRIGFIAMKSSNWELSEYAFSNITRLQPDDTKATLNLAISLLNMGNADEALPLLHKVQYLAEDDLSTSYLAWCLHLTGEDSKANEYFDKVVSPTGVSAVQKLHFLLNCNRNAEAYALLQSLIKQDAQAITAIMQHSPSPTLMTLIEAVLMNAHETSSAS